MDAQTASSRPGAAEGEDSSLSLLASGLKETGRAAGEAVRQQARQFAEGVGDELQKTGEDQKVRGVEALRTLAHAIDTAAGELNQSPAVSKSICRAAAAVSGLSDNLGTRSVSQLMDAAAELARARPALFIGGSVAAGFALARFFKSSVASAAQTAARTRACLQLRRMAAQAS